MFVVNRWDILGYLIFCWDVPGIIPVYVRNHRNWAYPLLRGITQDNLVADIARMVLAPEPPLRAGAADHHICPNASYTIAFNCLQFKRSRAWELMAHSPIDPKLAHSAPAVAVADYEASIMMFWSKWFCAWLEHSGAIMILSMHKWALA